MKWSYQFNPDMEYGVEMVASKENYDPPIIKHENYGKRPNVNFGVIELFSLIMVIPFWIFIYKFFYLLVLPLVPVSVVVFELIREIAPLNRLFMYGGSFLTAYIFYRVLKYFFSSLSLVWSLFYLFVIYILAFFAIDFLSGVYPQNEVLISSMRDLTNLITFIGIKI